MFTGGGVSSSFSVTVSWSKGYFRKFSRNVELSQKHEPAALKKSNRHYGIQVRHFLLVPVGTEFLAYVAHASVSISPGLPACVQDAN